MTINVLDAMKRLGDKNLQTNIHLFHPHIFSTRDQPDRLNDGFQQCRAANSGKAPATRNKPPALDNHKFVTISRPAEAPRQGGAGAPVLRGTSWVLTTFILLGDMFGLGCLSLPGDFARMGWLPGLGCLLAFALVDVYSGGL